MSTSETARTVIEKSIEISASAERVWELVSEPGWWINGGEYREHEITERDGVFLVTDPEHGTFPLSVVSSDRPSYLAYRWHEQVDDPRPDSPGTLTEFWIEPHGDGVVLRVRESGFETLGYDEAELREAVEGNTEGWDVELQVAARVCTS